MTDQVLKKVAEKIAKCLALASSDNPAEAEAARRQAEALMRKHGLNCDDVSAAKVQEIDVNTGSHRPPVYLMHLGGLIARAFSCEMVSTTRNDGFGNRASFMTFFGVGVKPELASYTFDVLRRQIIKDRKAYQTTLGRYKRSNKIRMANLFCTAWIDRIAKQVQDFSGSEQEKIAIDAYKSRRWGDDLEQDKRKRPNIERESDVKALQAGFDAAKDISIHRPVQTKAGKQIGQIMEGN
ncbi:DUF2786 domain-containing protein [Methylicorpusculum oleiharenae]|uniref:DUF7168 domain-containing protein n=1 Tax=Methylicorpusculum oleiharenae TaxID=1338687 RepID=UPI001356CA3A|nr:DUF2786 domain-containing protein [Methylicorpusculum oleiharenae]MCD2453562.1 DUF2786 domain-containing protein [Methylicorpusculum oleiharenae]